MIRPAVTVAAMLIAAAPALAQTATTTTTETQATVAAAELSGPAKNLAIIKELREAILAAEKAAAKPPVVKTDEQKQAEAAAIARHRDAFMARVEERLAEQPQG